MPATPALHTLRLGGVRVTDGALRVLAKGAAVLQELELERCPITDAGLLLALGSCPRLQRLALRDIGPRLTEAGARAAAAAASELEHLTLDGQQLLPPPQQQQQRHRQPTDSSNSGAAAAYPAAAAPPRRLAALTPELLRYDERVRYSISELQQLQRAAGAGGGAAAAAAADLRAFLPGDLLQALPEAR